MRYAVEFYQKSWIVVKHRISASHNLLPGEQRIGTYKTRESAVRKAIALAKRDSVEAVIYNPEYIKGWEPL